MTAGDNCLSKNIPLRDTYISATEPVYPYLSNFALINFSAPYCLNKDSAIAKYNTLANYTPTSWGDGSGYVVNTHCVRTWSNCSVWPDPSGAYAVDISSSVIRPYGRTRRTREAQLGDSMYKRAILNGMGDGSGWGAVPTAANLKAHTPYSPLNYDVSSNLNANGGSYARYVAGFNMSLYVVDAVSMKNVNLACVGSSNQEVLEVSFYPLLNFQHTNQIYGCDWNPFDTTSGYSWKFGSSELHAESYPLPAVTISVMNKQRCFHMWLPVLIYPIRAVNRYNNFTYDDTSGAFVKRSANNLLATFETVLCKFKGTFLDSNGDPVSAANAESIQFEIVNPPNLFNLSHTYEAKVSLGAARYAAYSSNRPIFCTETGSIPIRAYTDTTNPYYTSLLISPRCGAGMYTNVGAQLPMASDSLATGTTAASSAT
jgi:hypothetical protein